MLTSFEQVRQWITDNGFKRWVLYKDFTKTEKIIDTTGLAVADIPEKIAMTEKYLRWNGGHAYAAGATSNAASDLNVVTEIQLADAAPAQVQQQPTAGIGMQPQDIGAIEERLRKQIKAEIAQEQYEKERAEFEKERKEFEKDKQSVIGHLVEYFAPYMPLLNSAGQRRLVAGTPADTDKPVHAQPIMVDEKPEEQETQEPSAWDDFTEEEADELIGLMARFKKIEPDYMKLLTSVVEMAERGDSTYTMAKGFLVK